MEFLNFLNLHNFQVEARPLSETAQVALFSLSSHGRFRVLKWKAGDGKVEVQQKEQS